MTTIRDLINLDRDATEDESAEIKRAFDTASPADREALSLRWPLEWAEWHEENKRWGVDWRAREELKTAQAWVAVHERGKNEAMDALRTERRRSSERLAVIWDIQKLLDEPINSESAFGLLAQIALLCEKIPRQGGKRK